MLILWLNCFLPSGAAIGDLNTEKLPGPEALEVPGEKDGQTLMIKQQGVVEVYQWSLADSQWVKLGQVRFHLFPLSYFFYFCFLRI